MKFNLKSISALVSLTTFMSFAVSVPAFAQDYYTLYYKGVKVTNVTGPNSTDGIVKDGSAAAVLAVAKSQDGYYPGPSIPAGIVGNSKRRISYFSNVWANSELGKETISDSSTGNWCSEFASWCLYEAGVPYSECGPQLDTVSFREKFSKKNRLYKFTSSKPLSDKTFSSTPATGGELEPSDLKAGDILQINDHNSDDGYPNHTAIFVKLVSHNNEKCVYTYDGNKNVNGKRKVKAGNYYPLARVKAVIRPHYSN